MLKQETLKLLNSNNNFKDIFSICIGKSYLYQSRFIEYLGEYDSWDTNVKEGTLKLGERVFNVEYIGTTSNTDNYWYSSELESIIPDEYVDIMINTRKYMETLNLNELTPGKIMLNGDINGYNLSMIYIAFAPQNVAYFCGSGNTNIYMFIKDLPNDIFRKMNSTEFITRIMEIISTFNVNHKLMVEALLIENEIEYEENQKSIIAKFNENSIITVDFDNNGLIKNISGNLSL